jgi:tetratricopeptide (TPR) repeat protein
MPAAHRVILIGRVAHAPRNLSATVAFRHSDSIENRRSDGLHRLVSVDPLRAELDARDALSADDLASDERARLRWVLGLALRERGSLADARVELEAALQLAESSGLAELRARVGSSLAFLLGQLGDLDDAVALMRSVASELTGVELSRAIGQLGTILYWRGELAEAAERLEASCRQLAEFGDDDLATRYRSNLGAVLSLMGQHEAAEGHLRESIGTAERLSLPTVAGAAAANLGFVLTLRGELPDAIAAFERAETHYRASNAESDLPRLHADHAQALADSGLVADADGLIGLAIDMYRQQGQLTELAGVLLTAAEIRLAQRDLDAAIAAAADARDRFVGQGRASWAALATALELQARARQDRDPGLIEQLDQIAVELSRHGLPSESTRCRLVAAQLRTAGSAARSAVDADLRAAVEHGRPADRILLAYVDALSALNVGDRGSARRAITRGLDVATSNQAAFGSIETRAHAAIHGYALTELGARLAVDDGRPRELLLRIEATRLMSSRLPEVRPPADPELAAMLTNLRGLTATIADPASGDDQRHDAERDRIRVERDIRRRSRTVRGDSARIGVRDELGAALAMLDDRQLVAHAALDGRLHAVSVVGRRARLHDLGSIEGVREMLDEIAFSLNRLNRVQGSDASRLAAAEMLFEVAAELAELLLPADVADAMNPLVIVPTALLHDVPWALLPPLAGRPVSVNPSVSAWARSERTRQERSAGRDGLRTVGFVAGPGLEYADLEVASLAALYSGPRVATGADATVASCVDLLGSADLVHIACHGSFRTDNPMFSALHLADGPLIVHDLERLDRLPETVILPACSVATSKVLQGGSLLGLATALTTLGACSVIAPLTPVNDASSVTVMQRLHHELIAGSSPAAALAVAALEHDLADPTGAAFIALGA